MEAVELEKTVEELNELISLTQNKIRVTIDAYINEHKVFEVGQKIQIYSPEHENHWNRKMIVKESTRFAYVSDIKYDSYRKNIKYILKKAKKDGTISQHSDEYLELILYRQPKIYQTIF